MKNEVIESFNKFAEQYADFTFTNILQYELNRFISLIPENGTVLDLGCGSGRDVLYFLDFKLKPVGIDASEKLVEEAKTRVPDGKFEVMDMRNLSFKEGNFDGVWAQDAISYFSKEETQKTIKDIAGILKNEGIFFISVRKGKNEVLISYEKLGKSQVMVSLYEKEELESLLKKSGFEIMNSYLQDGQDFTWINIFAKKV